MRAKYSTYPLDLRKVIASKSPKVSSSLPEWLVKFLCKIICINDLNYLLNTYKDLPPNEFAGKCLEYTGMKYRIIGTENIPDNRCIFVSNHPLGGLDGLVIIHSLAPHCKNGVKLIVNDLLMNLEPLRSVFIPVNKHGRQNQKYIQTMDEAFDSDCQIVTFPAGLCSRLIDGKIQDTPWHKNFATRAIKSGRMIVPVYFEGRNSMFFYRLAKVRKWLRIKFNVEMLFLPHQVFYPTIKEAIIHVGIPFMPKESDSVTDIVEKTRQAVYSMEISQKY